jgi:hypothetical protein
MGYAVFTPQLSMFMGADHRYTRFGTDYQYPALSDPCSQANEHISHADWLDMDFSWIKVSDIVLRLPGESKGADMEVEYAERIGVPVVTSIAEIREYCEGGLYRGRQLQDHRDEPGIPDRIDEFTLGHTSE